VPRVLGPRRTGERRLAPADLSTSRAGAGWVPLVGPVAPGVAAADGAAAPGVGAAVGPAGVTAGRSTAGRFGAGTGSGGILTSAGEGPTACGTGIAASPDADACSGPGMAIAAPGTTCSTAVVKTAAVVLPTLTSIHRLVHASESSTGSDGPRPRLPAPGIRSRATSMLADAVHRQPRPGLRQATRRTSGRVY
jgi:hypothetical protein